MFPVLFTLLFVLTKVSTSFVQDPIVQLPNGLIRGRESVTIKAKTYYAFEKIPYATPPVGELRFKAPLPPANWDGILDTTYLDVTCHQHNPLTDNTESEDCLYINVYTPKLPTTEENVSLPTIFFIHGGAFVDGSSIYSNSDLIVENDVIFVTINYRLGLFGFLSTQDEVIPGNNGLKDQHLAIQWAHENIHLFGGDPERITIFGQSAGASSCAFQLLNQQSQGLFSGVILQSGTSINPWAIQRRAREFAFSTAALINDTFTNINDSVALLEFLLTVDAEDLKKAGKQFSASEDNPENEFLFHGGHWSPVIEAENEDAFITKKMFGLLQTGNVVTVPLLIGMTSEEILTLYAGGKDTAYPGYCRLNNAYLNADYLKYNLQAYDSHLDWLVPTDMQIEDQTNRTEMGRLIREIYTGGEPFIDQFGGGVRFYSDNGFTRSIIKHAELYSKVAKTYFYQFSYDGELGGNNIHYDGAEYVGHAEEYFYIFCSDFRCNFTNYPRADQITSERIISILTNFAKHRNPTPEPSELLQNITWPVVSTDSGDFLYVDINENLEIKNHPKEETYAGWTKLYDSLGYTDFDTY